MMIHDFSRGSARRAAVLGLVFLATAFGASFSIAVAQVGAPVASAQTAKQHCMTACRARYRDCRRMNQLPPSECRGIYEDCARYSCTGLGPG
jgi:hypothetical protein